MTETTMTTEEAKYIADELALPDFSLSEIDRAKMRETLWRYTDLLDHSNPHNAPAGWKLVPEGPTKGMVEAGCAVTCTECHMDCDRGPTGEIYAAMLSAAPEQGEGL